MNTRTTLILAVCLVLVGGYLFLVTKPSSEATSEHQTSQTGALWAVKPAVEDIQRIEVDSSRDPKRVFVREDDKWMITEPVKAIANKYQIENMARKVADLTAARHYDKNDKDRPSNETTGLDKPFFTVTLTDKADKAYAIKVGQPTPTGADTYVQKVGDETIYVIDELLKVTFDKRLSDLRDKRVTQFKPDEVVRLDVTGAENFELVKSGATWMLEKPVRAPASSDRVRRILNAVSSIYASEFIADNPPSLRAYGLESPRITVTATIEHKVEDKTKENESTQPAEEPEQAGETKKAEPKVETRTVTIAYGGPTDAKASKYFAKLSDAPTIFSVMSSALNGVTPTLDDLRDKSLSNVETAKAKEVEITLADGQVAKFEKGDDNQWHAADGSPAEQSLVQDVLRAAHDLKAIDFQDETVGIRTDNPRAVVRIVEEGKPQPFELRVLEPTPSGKNAYVQVASQPGIAVIDEDVAAQFLADPIAYRPRDMLAFAKTAVQRFEIDRNNQAIVLTKLGTSWNLTEPVEAKADNEAVRKIIADLSALRAQKVVGQGNGDAFGLDEPAVTVSMTIDRSKTAAGEESDKPNLAELKKTWEERHPGEPVPEDLENALKDVATTQPTTAPTTAIASQPALPEVHLLRIAKHNGKVYGMLDGSDLVYQINPTVYDNLTAEVRDTTVVTFNVPDVTGLTLVTPNGTMDLAGKDKNWTYEQDTTVAIDSEKVKEWLNVVRDLKTHRYVAYKASDTDLDAHGLANPAVKLIVQVPNHPTIELWIAATGPKDDAKPSRYATVAGRHVIFLLTNEQVGQIQKTLGDIEKKTNTTT